ncbi:hypothetical protein DM02DRAFT_613343 [Periconia macrospinosa]|uniref:Uncharacterized protein n=1 Tax=Periconia macrospinosa TaxID=97972 RepID=A0A2V1DUS8_9PLEO|nr:hypothetical protein DM02DRAFT_613343 [Periconia macrospinosa]
MTRLVHLHRRELPHASLSYLHFVPFLPIKEIIGFLSVCLSLMRFARARSNSRPSYTPNPT